MKKNINYILIIFFAFLPLYVVAKETHEDIKIKAEITKSGFVGEALTYEIKLLSSSPDISNVRIIKAPGLPDQVRKITGVVNNIRAERVKEKGKFYYSYTIMRLFIIPEKEGRYEISGAKFMVFIPHEKIVYHEFWGKRRTIEYEEMTVECAKARFNVKNLPKNNTDKEYSGAVGNYNIKGWFPPGKISKGNEAYAVFTISGFGSMNNIRLPNLYRIFRTGCTLKEVEQTDEEMQRDGRLFSQVTLTCRFVPEADEFSIDPLSLLFFNPKDEKYYIAKSDTLDYSPTLSGNSKKVEREAIEI